MTQRFPLDFPRIGRSGAVIWTLRQTVSFVMRDFTERQLAAAGETGAVRLGGGET